MLQEVLRCVVTRSLSVLLHSDGATQCIVVMWSVDYPQVLVQERLLLLVPDECFMLFVWFLFQLFG